MEPTKLYIIVSATFVLVIGYDIYEWSRSRTFSLPEVRIKRLKNKMNFTYTVIGTISVLAAISFHINIFNYARPIDYSHYSNITLKDFKGFKRPSQTLDGGNEFAFITTSIEWQNSENEVEVRALFHPSRSYVFNSKIVGKLLLQHELYHFHVTEYFARQIRKSLEIQHREITSELIDSTIAKYARLENTMQGQYDEQTYHGYILKEQKRWQQKIDSLLISHRDFAQTTITN